MEQDTVRLGEWLSILAIVLGPLVGIWVTRWIDDAKDDKNRRWQLFETLMRTRSLELSSDHVAAINMIPVLFAKQRPVMAEWERLMDVLADPAWKSSDEGLVNGLNAKAANVRTDLINKIAEAVRAKLPTKEEHRLGYAPSAWLREWVENQSARKGMIDVLEGRRAIKMIAGVFQMDGEAPEQIEAAKGTERGA